MTDDMNTAPTPAPTSGEREEASTQVAIALTRRALEHLSFLKDERGKSRWMLPEKMQPRDFIDTILSCLTPSAIVPVEPTPEMLKAAWLKRHGGGCREGDEYRAMLAAAPTAQEGK